jgi:quinolinate synthase
MKMNTLQKLRDALFHLEPRVEMEESLRKRAEAPLLRMLEQSLSIPSPACRTFTK